MLRGNTLCLGADDFWYWSIGAFVFSGEDTVLSISGKDYETAHRTITDDDIVTIDLSPRKDGLWGDYARTLIVEIGRALHDPAATTNSDAPPGSGHNSNCTLAHARSLRRR